MTYILRRRRKPLSIFDSEAGGELATIPYENFAQKVGMNVLELIVGGIVFPLLIATSSIERPYRKIRKILDKRYVW